MPMALAGNEIGTGGERVRHLFRTEHPDAFDDFPFEKEFVVRRARVIEQLQDVSDRAR